MLEEPVKPFLVLPPVLNLPEDLLFPLLVRIGLLGALNRTTVREPIQKVVNDLFESHDHTSGVMELIRMTNIMLPNGTIR
ncbi:hypothetical protein DSECCO2_627830 [anaerobic digester metagenome]